MKIIKSILLVSFSLCTSIAVHAQQQEEKTAIKALPAALTKSPAPDAKSATIPVTNELKADAVPAVPSPFTKEDNTKLPVLENITLKTVEAKTANSQLTAEQLKTLNGNGTLPKQSAVSAGIENVKPLPVSKPVLVKEQ